MGPGLGGPGEPFPIWDDVRTFDGFNGAGPWRARRVLLNLSLLGWAYRASMGPGLGGPGESPAGYARSCSAEASMGPGLGGPGEIQPAKA